MHSTNLVLATAALAAALSHGTPLTHASKLVARDDYNACTGECNAQGGDCYTHTASVITGLGFTVPNYLGTLTW